MRTLWNSSLGHDFEVLLLIFPLCFFSLRFVGTRCSNIDTLGRDCFIFLRAGVYDTFKSPLKWLDSMIMLFLNHFPYQGLPSTHLLLLWNWIFYQTYLGGEQLSSKDTFEIGLVSELVSRYSSKAPPVGTGPSQPLQCYCTQWTWWPRTFKSSSRSCLCGPPPCFPSYTVWDSFLMFYMKHEISKQSTSKSSNLSSHPVHLRSTTFCVLCGES